VKLPVKSLRRLIPLTTILLAAGLAFPQAKGSQAALDKVLERMGAVGKDFRSFRADFTQRNYVAVLKEYESPESGIFIYARAKDGSALVRQEFKAPGKKVLTIKGGEIMVFQPSLNQATKMNLGKNRDKAEFLALGIGQSPAKMRETFDIEYQGEARVNDTLCSVLLLKPKSTTVSAYFATITIWISNANNLPLQQKLVEPNGNYMLNTFSSEKLNPAVSDSDFEQKLPKGVEIQVIK
jgi:outer membrane lipoprotein-sorting protein